MANYHNYKVWFESDKKLGLKEVVEWVKTFGRVRNVDKLDLLPSIAKRQKEYVAYRVGCSMRRRKKNFEVKKEVLDFIK
jgi:Fe-S oxidoreductase